MKLYACMGLKLKDYIPEKWKPKLTRNPNMSVRSSIVHNCPKTATQSFFGRSVVEQTVVQPYHETYSSIKRNELLIS